MNVRSIVLTTGQELVAEIIQEGPSGITVKRPLVVHVMRGHDGAPTLGFAQWSMVRTDAPVVITREGVLSLPAEVEPDVERAYLQNTTGIALAGPDGSQLLHG